MAIADLNKQMNELKKHPRGQAKSAGPLASSIGGAARESDDKGSFVRSAIVFVGGFPQDTARHSILKCLDRIVDDSFGLIRTWIPDKRWSSGRILFESESCIRNLLKRGKLQEDNYLRSGQGYFISRVNSVKYIHTRQNITKCSTYTRQKMQ